MSIKENSQRYMAAAHAMQSGVAMEINQRGPSLAAADAKHLRVGINSAMVEHSAVVKLLMDNGVFTEEEYYAALADMMEKEKQRYEEHLSDILGTKVTLA